VKVIKIALLESYEKSPPVLLAYLRFSEAVNSSSGSEIFFLENAPAPTPRNSQAVSSSAA